jgi:hypothetical protein
MSKQIFPSADKRWLQEDEQIWRYVPLQTLFFYLNGLVFIPSIAKLRESDPFEGEFYPHIAWFNSTFDRHYGNEAKKIEKWILDNDCSDSKRDQIEGYLDGVAGFNRDCYMKFVRETRFAWCWFRSCRESAAMWRVYGNQGVAVKTTVGKVAKVLEAQSRKFICGPMTYVDHRNGRSVEFNPEQESDFPLLLRPFLLKREEYKSEQEIRFIIAAAERERGGILLSDVNPKDWISAIRLWPKLETAEAQSLCETIKKLLPQVDCSRSDLFSDSPGTSRLSEDLNAGFEQQCDSAWQGGQDGIPSLLKEP